MLIDTKDVNVKCKKRQAGNLFSSSPKCPPRQRQAIKCEQIYMFNDATKYQCQPIQNFKLTNAKEKCN